MVLNFWREAFLRASENHFFSENKKLSSMKNFPARETKKKRGERSRSHNLYMEASQTIKCKSPEPEKKRISASLWRNKILLFECIAAALSDVRGELSRVDVKGRQKPCISIIQRV